MKFRDREVPNPGSGIGRLGAQAQRSKVGLYAGHFSGDCQSVLKMMMSGWRNKTHGRLVWAPQEHRKEGRQHGESGPEEVQEENQRTGQAIAASEG